MGKHTNTDTIIAVVAAGAARPLMEEAPKKPGKGKKDGSRKAKPSLEQLGVPADGVAVIEECEKALRDLDRKDTEQVFRMGAVLAEAKDACGSQEVWAAWSKKRCGISRRSADSYVGVHERLAEHRELFVERGMQRVSMYALANAAPKKIAAVVERVRGGDIPPVSDLRAFLNEGTEPKAPMQACDIPGAEGIKALVRERMKQALDPLMAALAAMLREVRQELATHRSGKALNKGRLAGKVERSARQARCELLGLAGGFEANSANAIWRQEDLSFPADSGWGRVLGVLLVLGSRESWPKDKAAAAWLEAEVEPALSWAVGPKVAAAIRKAEEDEASAAAAERAKAGAGKSDDRTKARREELKRIKAKLAEEAAARAAASPFVPGAVVPKSVLKEPRFVQYDVTDYLGGNDTPEQILARARADAVARGEKPVRVDFYGRPAGGWPEEDEALTEAAAPAAKDAPAGEASAPPDGYTRKEGRVKAGARKGSVAAAEDSETRAVTSPGAAAMSGAGDGPNKRAGRGKAQKLTEAAVADAGGIITPKGRKMKASLLDEPLAEPASKRS